MAIVNFCGWESGDSIESSATSGTFSVQSTTKRTGTYALRSNPTTTAVGYHSFGVHAATGVQGDFAIANLFVTFYFRYATKPAANNEEIFSAYVVASTNLRLNSSGNLVLYQATTLQATGTAVLTADTWYRIDVNFNDTANTQEIKVNGTVDISGTVATVGTFLRCHFGKQTNRNGQTVDFFYDDMCISDSAYPGAGECKLGVPIGAGAASGWTAGTGADNFNEVDEIPHDTDTTYIGALATEDNLDHTFDMQSVATIGIGGTIGAVKTMVHARTDSVSGVSAVAHRRLFNGSGFELTALELTTTYALLAMVEETDPSAGGGAITTADFDSIEVGMAANTIAQVQRFTVAYVSAWSDGAVVNPEQKFWFRTMHVPGMRYPVRGLHIGRTW